MDWENKVLTARGYAESGLGEGKQEGAQPGRSEVRQARIRAQNGLWKGLQLVRVDGARRVQDVLRDDPDKVQALRELVHTAFVQALEDTQEPRKTGYEARLSLTGESASVCIPAQAWYEDKEMFSVQGNATARTGDSGFSGLIVDARGLGAKPALICRLYDQQGRLIFGPSMMSRQRGIEQGVVGYSSSMEQARASSRVGESPLQVRAQGVHRGTVSDFDLRAEDVKPLWVTGSADILQHGKVIVVLQDEHGDRVVEYPLEGQ
jgi:hypothetical protein